MEENDLASCVRSVPPSLLDSHAPTISRSRTCRAECIVQSSKAQQQKTQHHHGCCVTSLSLQITLSTQHTHTLSPHNTHLEDKGRLRLHDVHGPQERPMAGLVCGDAALTEAHSYRLLLVFFVTAHFKKRTQAHNKRSVQQGLPVA